MRISLNIEADSVEAFLAELATLQEIPLGTLSPAKAMAHVAALVKEVEPPASVETSVKGETETEIETEISSVQDVEGTVAAKEEPVVPAAKPVRERKSRGRPRKAPVEETAPEVAPAAQEGKSGNGSSHLPQPTRDDLLAACREYVTAYSVNFAQNDLPKLWQKEIDESIRRQSDIQEKDFARAIDIVLTAVKENPFKRGADGQA